MSLSVRIRIALAMTLVVAVSLVSGAAVLYYNAEADEAAERAATAAQVARVSSDLAARLTEWVSETNDLLIAVSKADEKEEYWEYGGILGSEDVVSVTAAHLIELEPSAETVLPEWDAIRLGVYTMINTEGEASGSQFRITQNEDGEYRNSVVTNLEPPDELAGLSGLDLRNTVRKQIERLKVVTIADVSDAALQAEMTARDTAEESRQLTRTVSVVGAAVSIIVALMAGLWLSVTIAVPLTRATEYADTVAAGDFAATFGHHRSDEIGTLTKAVERMRSAILGRIDTMREMAGLVLVTAESVEQHVDAAQKALSKGAGASDEVDGSLASAHADAGELAELVKRIIEA